MITNKKPLLYFNLLTSFFYFLFSYFFFYSCEEIFFIVAKKIVYSLEEIFLQFRRKFFIVVRKFFLSVHVFIEFFFLYLQGKKIFFYRSVPGWSMHSQISFFIFARKIFLQKCPRSVHVNKKFFYSFEKNFFVDIRHIYLFSFQLFMMGKNLKSGC